MLKCRTPAHTAQAQVDELGWAMDPTLEQMLPGELWVSDDPT